MTEPTGARPGRKVVPEIPGIVDRFRAAKQAYEIAEAEFAELKTDLKAYLTAIADPATGFPYTKYELGTLDLKWQPSTRVSTTALKAKYPDIARELSVTSGSWVLTERKPK